MSENPIVPTWGASARWQAHVVRDAAARHLDEVAWQHESIRDSPTPGPSREAGIVGLVLTGYLDTEIRSRLPSAREPDRYRWSFGPGVDRPEPLRCTPAHLSNGLTSLTSNSNCRLSLGWIDGDRRHHLAPGRATVAAHLARPSTVASPRDLVQAASGLGAVLKQLGQLDTNLHDLAAPTGPRRLAHWLRTGDGPWAAGVMHDRLVARLGTARTEEIISWVEEMPRERLVHGRAGLASTVLSESSAPSALLTGDEVACGPRDFDLAWVLGEFLVTEHMTRYVSDDDQAARQRQLITDCRDAFLIAYGPSKDLVTTGRTTSLRVLLEIHDSAAYLDRMLDDLVAQAAEIVDCAR